MLLVLIELIYSICSSVKRSSDFCKKFQDYPDNKILGTVINAIDTVKADKESPNLTGIPTAPTAEITINNT